MWCPKCLHEKTKIVATIKQEQTTRFRVCPFCDFSFLTIEDAETNDFWLKYAKNIGIEVDSSKNKTK